jgi:hypothetical protein
MSISHTQVDQERPAGRRLAAAVTLACALVLLGAAGLADAKPISKPRWVRNVLVTEYFPVPERWFTGAPVYTPGLNGKHRVDWLYSAEGLSMEGDGVGLDGRRYHIEDIGSQGWVTAEGRRTRPTRRGWSRGKPFWRAVGWRNRHRRVTFPLAGGGWWRGVGVRYIEPRGISFAPGPSKPLDYYRSVAVDPRLVPLGSRVYIPAYRNTAGGGWFRAEDTGGAIIGRHLDVYRPAPPSPGGGNVLSGQRVFVDPPGGRGD